MYMYTCSNVAAAHVVGNDYVILLLCHKGPNRDKSIKKWPDTVPLHVPQ